MGMKGTHAPRTRLLLAAVAGHLIDAQRRDPFTDPLLCELTGTAEYNESGIQLPLLCTAQVEHLYVRWTRRDNRRQTSQHTKGRRWDVCYLLAEVMRRYIRACHREGREPRSGDSVPLLLWCVPRDGVSTEAVPVRLRCLLHTDDSGLPMLILTEWHDALPWQRAA